MFREGLKRRVLRRARRCQEAEAFGVGLCWHPPACTQPSGCRPARDGDLQPELVRRDPVCSLRMPHTKRAVFLLLAWFPGRPRQGPIPTVQSQRARLQGNSGGAGSLLQLCGLTSPPGKRVGLFEAKMNRSEERPSLEAEPKTSALFRVPKNRSQAA